MRGIPRRHARVRFLYLLGFVLAVILAWPILYPWMISLALRSVGAKVIHYSPRGYTGCMLEGVSLPVSGAALEIGSVFLPSPIRWIWDLGHAHKQSVIVVNEAVIQLTLSADASDPEGEAWDMYAVYNSALESLERMHRWTPALLVNQARVRVMNQEVLIKTLEVRDKKLVLDGYWADFWEHFLLTIDGAKREQQSVELLLPKWDCVARFWFEEDEYALKILNQFKVGKTQAYGEHRLFQGDPLSSFSRFEAQQLHIPASWVYPSGEGNLLLQGQFLLKEAVYEGSFSIIHLSDKTINGGLSFQGDRDQISIHSLYFDNPTYSVKLSEDVVFDFRKKAFNKNPRLNLEVDLAAIGVESLHGTVHGTFVALDESMKHLGGEVLFDQLSYNALNVRADSLHIEKNEDEWRLLPWSLWTDQDSSFVIAAGANSKSKMIHSLECKVRFGQDVMRAFKLEQAPFGEVEISADVKGIWGDFPESLDYAFEARLNQVAVSGMHVFDVALSGQGKGFSLSRYQLMGVNAGSRIESSGSVDWYWDRIFIKTENAFLQWPNGRLDLDKPFNFYFHNATQLRQGGALWRESIFNLGLVHFKNGDGLTISLKARHEHGKEGELIVHVTEASDAIWDLFFEPSPYFEHFYIRGLYYTGEWNGEDPMGMDLQASVDLKLPYLDWMLLSFNMINQDEVLNVEGKLLREDKEVIALNGSIPVFLTPGDPDAWLNIMMKKDFFIECIATSSPSLEHLLKSSFNVYTEMPQLSLRISGKPFSPSGVLSASCDVLAYTQHKNLSKEPFVLTDIALDLLIEPEGIELKHMGFYVEGKEARLKSRLEMRENDWAQFLEKDFNSIYEKLTGEVFGDWIPLRPLDLLLPKSLKPEGAVYVNLQRLEWGSLLGEIVLKDVATHPLEAIGSIAQVQADFVFEEDKINVKSFHFELSDRPVDLTGSMAFGRWGMPKYDFVLKGEDVPFVRSPGLVLRGSLDMHLKTLASGVTQLSGDVHLQNSVLIVDLATLQSDTAHSGKAYPYFSVIDAFLSDWKLNVNIKGKRFMRIQTPLFKSILTSDFKLSGTFEQPTLLGEITMDEGSLYFPFATFKLIQGGVRVARDRPDTPIISLNAKSRAFGYDLRCHVEGAATEPVITFSSLPSLDSNDVLAMVTTGKVPPGHIQQSKEARLSSFGVFLGNSVLSSLGFVDANTDRLEVITGEDLTETGRSTMSVEYHLTDRASLVGEYDRFDDLNGDFKYMIFSM